MRVYEAIVRGLEGVGVGAAFGGAGENAAGLMLALRHSARIRPVITRHEQAEAALADALLLDTPPIIDAHIARLALPVDSPSPEGLLAGVTEMVLDRINPG